MASMYAFFTFRTDLTPLLTLTLRYKSGHLIDIAFDVLQVNERNVRDLELNERSPAFRKLESFFKKLNIKVRIGNTERKRTIRGLVPDAGNFSFSKDGMMITIAVRNHCTTLTTLNPCPTSSRTTSWRSTISHSSTQGSSGSSYHRRVPRIQ